MQGKELRGINMTNPALFRTKVKDKMPLIRDHKNCTNKELRFSCFRKRRGYRFVVHVCKECGHQEENEVGVLY